MGIMVLTACKQPKPQLLQKQQDTHVQLQKYGEGVPRVALDSKSILLFYLIIYVSG